MRTDKTIKVHGHRGSRGTHPENTLPAFKEAVSAGADVLEMDLQLSKDNIPVVCHEPMISGRLCRYSNGTPVEKPIAIRTLTVSQIQSFDCGSIPREKFPEQRPIPNTMIPTLEEVLCWATRASSTIEFNIETKMTACSPSLIAPPELFVEKVVELLHKYRVIEQAILQSFDFRTLEQAKRLAPNLRLSCLFEREDNFCELTARLGGQIASPNFMLITSQRVMHCHEMGIQVVPWTVNAPGDWRSMIDCGVDAVITDYPRRLVEYLAKN